MKFLCIPCDTPMRLSETRESEPNSLSVAYACPECGYEMAMLTNAQETQMVRSLGVRIGPAAAAAVSVPGDDGATADAATSKCPFGAMFGGAEASAETSGDAAPSGPRWTSEALARLEAIPEMVRPMARAGVEMVAREQGLEVIDEAALAAARSRFGM